MYRPSQNFNVPMKLLIPQKSYINGVLKKVFPDVEDVSNDLIIMGSFRTFGGTENVVNDVYSNISTATIDTWFRPEIKSDCRVVLLDDMSVWEIVSEPENIERRNQFLQFKVKKYAGNV